MKKILLACFSFVLLSIPTIAQDRVISGKVTSADDGTTLPGVNVVLKGTTTGTGTDANGEYKLSVPGAGGTLVFSFIGFKSIEVEIGERTTVDVELSADITQLSEVVVTGVGIQRESKNLGYSVATVKNETLNQARVTNIAAALSGKVSGLQINQVNNGVNGGVRVVLRGNRSFLGNNQALVVLDGVQVSSDVLNLLNPNDVENVSVLKGANAAAIYGSQASNGVLVITTKTPKKGAAPEITISSTTQLERLAFLPKLQEKFGSYGGEGPTDPYSFNIDPNFPAGYISYENQSYGPAFNGQQVQIGRTLLDGSKYMTSYSSKYKEHLKFFETGVTNQTDGSFSVSEGKSAYYVSFQDVQKKGTLPKDRYSRDVFRFNGNTEYGIFKLGYKLSYTLTHQDVNSNQGGVYFDWMNTPMHIPLTKFKDWRNNIWASPTGYYNDFFFNPYMTIDRFRQEQNRQDFLGTLELSADPTSWLNLLGRVGVTSQTQHDLFKTLPVTYDRTLGDPQKFTIANGNVPGGVTNSDFTRRRINLDYLATFHKEVIKDLNVNWIVGGNLFDDYSYGSNIGTGTLLYLDPIIFNTQYRTGNLDGGIGMSRTRRLAAYSDLTATYKFVTLHGTFRNDWNSLLAKDNRSFSYPGADVSFRLTDAIPALKDNKFLSFAKITASIAKVGNVSLNPYQLQTVFNAGAPFSGSAGNVPVLTRGAQTVAAGLKPEFTLSREVSLEVGLMENLVNLKAVYYQTNTTNQTVSFDVSNGTGFSTALINAGEMLNKGLEFDLNISPLSNSEFKWTIGGNYTYLITNTPLSVYTSASGDKINQINVRDENGGTTNSFAIVGQQYPMIRVSDWKRDPQGHIIVDAITGLPSRDPNIKNMGQANPKHRLGLTTNLNYKGFSLSVLVDYRSGNFIFNQLGNNIEFGGLGYKSATAGRQRFVMPNSVIQTGTDGNGDPIYSPNTNITVNDGNYNFWQSIYNNVSSNYVTSAAFWKLREVSFGYQVPKSILASTKFVKSARISLVGRNLLMWRPKSNQWTDPEFSTDTGNGLGTTTSGQTPPTRLYGANITLTF